MPNALRKGFLITPKTDHFEPHMKAGRPYEVKACVGQNRFTLAKCDSGGPSCEKCCFDGWYYSYNEFAPARRDLVPGDKIICFGSMVSHFRGDAKTIYTIKYVFMTRTDHGYQKFVVTECQKDMELQRVACSCRDGREWVFNLDFDYAGPDHLPVTPEEAKRARSLPTVEDVASFFGIRRIE